MFAGTEIHMNSVINPNAIYMTNDEGQFMVHDFTNIDSQQCENRLTFSNPKMIVTHIALNDDESFAFVVTSVKEEYDFEDLISQQSCMS